MAAPRFGVSGSRQFGRCRAPRIPDTFAGRGCRAARRTRRIAFRGYSRPERPATRGCRSDAVPPRFAGRSARGCVARRATDRHGRHGRGLSGGTRHGRVRAARRAQADPLRPGLSRAHTPISGGTSHPGAARASEYRAAAGWRNHGARRPLVLHGVHRGAVAHRTL